MSPKCGPINMLRQYVGWVIVARSLVQNEVFCTNFVLDPQVRHLEVADLTQAAPSANPTCRGRVRVHIESAGEAQVKGKRPGAYASGRAAAYARPLCIAGR